MPDKQSTRKHRKREQPALSTPTVGKYLTRAEVAHLLGVKPRTVDYHVRQGKFGRIKAGNKVFFDVEEIERFVGYEITTTDLTLARTQRAVSKMDKLTAQTAQYEWQKEQERKVSALQNRLQYMEQVAGIGGKGRGLDKAALFALQEEIVRASLRVHILTDEEKMQWMRKISAMDYQTVNSCFTHRGLANLPVWMLKLGSRITASLSGVAKEEALLHCRNLRLLMQYFTPQRPICYCSFIIPKNLSPIEALVIASHAQGI
jgi:hypothetical protein